MRSVQQHNYPGGCTEQEIGISAGFPLNTIHMEGGGGRATIICNGENWNFEHSKGGKKFKGGGIPPSRRIIVYYSDLGPS